MTKDMFTNIDTFYSFHIFSNLILFLGIVEFLPLKLRTKSYFPIFTFLYTKFRLQKQYNVISEKKKDKTFSKHSWSLSDLQKMNRNGQWIWILKHVYFRRRVVFSQSKATRGGAYQSALYKLKQTAVPRCLFDRKLFAYSFTQYFLAKAAFCSHDWKEVFRRWQLENERR